MKASASGSSRTVNVTDANEEPRRLAVVALISSFVAVQWREEGQVNVGGGTGCKSLFLPPPHTRARARPRWQLHNMYRYWLDFVILRYPAGGLPCSCALCSISRGALSITFIGGSISVSPLTVGPWLSAGGAPRGRGARWEEKKNLRLNGRVGNPTSSSVDICMWSVKWGRSRWVVAKGGWWRHTGAAAHSPPALHPNALPCRGGKSKIAQCRSVRSLGRTHLSWGLHEW